METAQPAPKRQSMPLSFYLSSPTVWLIVVNTIVFLFTCLASRHFKDIDVDSLVRFGANFGPRTLGGEPWRLLTAMFLHGGMLHIVLNMWVLLNLGILAEIVFGRRSYLLMYLESGLVASLVSVWWHFHTGNAGVVGVGASGAIFGLAGALLPALALQKNARLRAALKGNLISIVIFVVYTVAYGMKDAHTDNAAHLGGLAAGLLFGFALPSAPGSAAQHHRARRTAVFVIATAALLASFAWVQRSEAGVLDYAHAQRSFQRKDFPSAIQYLNKSLERDPHLVDSQYMLGLIYLQMEKNEEAQKHFAEAVRLAPDWADAHSELCVAYLRMRDFADAMASCRRAVQLDPANSDRQFNLGLTQRASEDLPGAIDSFRKAEKLRPGDFDEEFMLGEALADAGQSAEAVSHLQLALKAQPDDQRTRLLLARLLLGAGRRDEARQVLGR